MFVCKNGLALFTEINKIEYMQNNHLIQKIKKPIFIMGFVI